MDNIYKGDTIQELVKKDFIIKKNKVKLNTYNVFINKKFTEGNNGILVIYAPWCESCVLSKNMWENFARLFKYKFKIWNLEHAALITLFALNPKNKTGNLLSDSLHLI